MIDIRTRIKHILYKLNVTEYYTDRFQDTIKAAGSEHQPVHCSIIHWAIGERRVGVQCSTIAAYGDKPRHRRCQASHFFMTGHSPGYLPSPFSSMILYIKSYICPVVLSFALYRKYYAVYCLNIFHLGG